MPALAGEPVSSNSVRKRIREIEGSKGAGKTLLRLIKVASWVVLNKKVKIMKNHKKIISTLLTSAILILSAVTFLNMGGGAEQASPTEPQFVELEDDAKSFIATVIDEGETVRIKDISFTGQISIRGVRRLTDDKTVSSGTIEIDFGSIKELEVVQRSFSVKGLDEREYVLVNGISSQNNPLKNLLFPKSTTFSGLSMEAGMENFKRAWYLRDIKKIKIEGLTTIIQGGKARAR